METAPPPSTWRSRGLLSGRRTAPLPTPRCRPTIHIQHPAGRGTRSGPALGTCTLGGVPTCPHHRHDSGLDRLGQRRPGAQHVHQFGVILHGFPPVGPPVGLGRVRKRLRFNGLRVFGDGLENRCTGNRTGGSNPSSSVFSCGPCLSSLSSSTVACRGGPRRGYAVASPPTAINYGRGLSQFAMDRSQVRAGAMQFASAADRPSRRSASRTSHPSASEVRRWPSKSATSFCRPSLENDIDLRLVSRHD